MTNKRWISAAVSMMMAAAMSTSAFAAVPETPPDGVLSEVTGSAVESMKVTTEAQNFGVIVKMMLPAKADLLLNPYRLDGESRQVLSSTTTIQNLSLSDVNVYANSCTATVEGNQSTKLVTAPIKSGDTSNSVQLFLRASVGSADLDETSPYRPATATTVGDVPVVTSAAKTPVLIARLKRSPNGTTAAADGVVNIKMVGSMSDAPLTPWNPDDTLAVATVYSAQPTTIVG